MLHLNQLNVELSQAVQFILIGNWKRLECSCLINPLNMFFTASSVPIPKDVEHFRKERKLAIDNSLQVLNYGINLGRATN